MEWRRLFNFLKQIVEVSYFRYQEGISTDVRPTRGQLKILQTISGGNWHQLLYLFQKWKPTEGARATWEERSREQCSGGRERAAPAWVLCSSTGGRKIVHHTGNTPLKDISFTLILVEYVFLYPNIVSKGHLHSSWDFSVTQSDIDVPNWSCPVVLCSEDGDNSESYLAHLNDLKMKTFIFVKFGYFSQFWLTTSFAARLGEKSKFHRPKFPIPTVSNIRLTQSVTSDRLRVCSIFRTRRSWM